MRNKPTLFIGSSSSALPIVDLFVEALSSHVSCVPWKQAGQFNSEGTNTTFEALRSAAFQFDFALFIICPDDQLHLSGKEPTLWTARDNVIFEAGLFLGSIGSERVFLAQQSTKERLRIPTDLLGTAMPAFEWVENDRVQSLASINKTAIGFKVAIEKQGFLQFHLRLACGWGREPDPDRFEVELEGVRLSEQMHLIQGKNIAIAARLESPTINFEDDLDVVYSMARSVPRELSDMIFQIPTEEFRRFPIPKKDRYQARVVLIPPNVDPRQYSCLKEAQANGCRIVDTLSCKVAPPKRSISR